jgi:hypothetical protein
MRKIIAAGATPKLTTSERESRTLPFSEVARRILAAVPSRKSKTAAIIMNNAAASRFLQNTNTMEINPEHKFIRVRRFGICL